MTNNGSYNPPDKGLARVINRGRQGVHIVFFPSYKNSRVIVCESTLEADFCQLLEFDPEVISYIPQPVKISIWVNGVLKEYTPDFQVTYRLKPDEFYEVKPAAVRSWDEYMEIMRYVEQYFKDKNQIFKLVVDTEIRKEPFLGNLIFLYSKIHRVSQNEITFLLDCMRRHGGEVGYDDLLEMDDAPTLGSLAKAIYEGLVDIDLTKSFNQETKLRLHK